MLDSTKTKIKITKALLNKILAQKEQSIPDHFQYIKEKIETEFGSFLLLLYFKRRHIVIELSPTKHLVGHNIVGTNFARKLILGAVRLIYQNYHLRFTKDEKAFYARQDFSLTRGDATGGFLVGSQKNVVNTMELIREHLLAHGHHIVVHEGPNGIETIYVGKSSTRSTVKFYNKYLEIMAKGAEAMKELPYYDEVMNYAKKVVRFEVTVRTSDELKRLGLKKSSEWNPFKVRELLTARLRKLGFSDQLLTELPPGVVAGLNQVKGKRYEQWLAGEYLRKTLKPPNFARDRKYFLSHGVDITRTPADTQDAVVLSSRVSPEKLKMTYPMRFVELGAVFK